MTHKEAYDKYYENLVKCLPLGDALFIAKLSTYNLFPGDTSDQLKALSTQAAKASYFLGHVIEPALDIDSTSSFDHLLSAMEQCDYANVKKLSSIIKSEIDKANNIEPDASKRNQAMIDFMIEARKQKRTIKVRYGRVLFSGSSGVGKTSFYKLLMKKDRSKQHISTKLAQPEQVIAAIKADVHNEDGCVEFNELNIEDEILKLQSYLKVIAHEQQPNKKSEITSPSEQPIEEVKLCGVEIQIASKMSSSTITKTIQKGDEMNIFTFMDTGGQPQFISMIPAVNSSAMVTFIVHDLQNSLNDKVTVTHGDKDGKRTFRPYTIGCTNLELIKSLISFSNNKFLQKKPFLEKICEKKRKENISYLSFIGSHLDKANENSAQETDNSLDIVVKDSGLKYVWMGTHPPHKYLIPVNNLTSEEDNEYATHDTANKIRKKLHDNILEQERYDVPIVWVLLELEIRKKCGEEQKFIKYHEIVKLCHDHNLIQREDDIKNGLRFYHLFGVLLYFDEIPELCDYVFTDYQWVFNNLTEIVYQSYFNYGQDNIEVQSNFKWKGCFTESLLDKCDLKLKHIDESLREKEFDFKQGFIKLLEYLRIIAPLSPVDDCIEYFMPSLLSTCDLESKQCTLPPGVIPLNAVVCDKTEPLVVQFKLRNKQTDRYGSFPRGTFCCLVVELLQDELTWHLFWSDEKEMVFDNLVTLLYRPAGQHITLIDRISYLEVIMLRDKKSIYNSIHYKLKQILKNALYKIGEKLNFYNFELAFGFLCRTCSKERHVLLWEVSDIRLECFYAHSIQKTSKHTIWDKEDFHTKSQQQTTLIETDGGPPCKKLKTTQDTQMKIPTTATANTASAIQPCYSQLHHITQQSGLTTGVTMRDEITEQPIKLLDPDRPFNYSTTQLDLKNRYDKLIRLNIGDDLIISLFQKDVITLEEKITMGELKERKRMEYLLDRIIMPSLKSDYSSKYINFLNVMKSSDDVLVKNVASDLISLLV